MTTETAPRETLDALVRRALDEAQLTRAHIQSVHDALFGPAPEDEESRPASDSVEGRLEEVIVVLQKAAKVSERLRARVGVADLKVKGVSAAGWGPVAQ